MIYSLRPTALSSLWPHVGNFTDDDVREVRDRLNDLLPDDEEVVAIFSWDELGDDDNPEYPDDEVHNSLLERVLEEMDEMLIWDDCQVINTPANPEAVADWLDDVLIEVDPATATAATINEVVEGWVKENRIEGYHIDARDVREVLTERILDCLNDYLDDVGEDLIIENDIDSDRFRAVQNRYVHWFTSNYEGLLPWHQQYIQHQS